MDLKTHRQKLLQSNPEFRKEYYSYDLSFEVGQMILEARTRLGITQKELANKIHTKQSGVARAESGKSLPSLTFLNKIASVLKTKLIVRFGSMKDYVMDSETTSSNKDFVEIEKNKHHFGNHLFAVDYSFDNQPSSVLQEEYIN